MARKISRIPNGVHRSVREVFLAAVSDRMSLKEIATKSGVSRAAFDHWASGRSPSVDNLEAALNVLGYGLVAVPLDQIKD